MLNKKTNVSKTKLLLIAAIAISAFMLILSLNVINAQAKTFHITSPDQLEVINNNYEGYGPGTYIIDADFSLSDSGKDRDCSLLSGNFVIDFNGHTVQSANPNKTVFTIAGANVILMDSKASSSKPSVRSYGLGCIQLLSGSLDIRSGNYVGISNGSTNPSALHVGGGSCTVYGGYFYGDYVGASCLSASLNIHGGTFQAGYAFALMDFSGNATAAIQITNANFISGRTTYGGQFALGAYIPNSYYDFSRWLAGGASFSPSFQTGYWNMQSSLTAYPTMSNYFAVSYNTPNLAVTGGTVVQPPAASAAATAPAKTKIKSVTAKKKALKVKWSKKAGATGYQIQLATDKKFKKNVKTVTVNNATATSKTVKGLKKNKKYYVRIRTLGNGGSSKWSKAVTKKTK